MADELNQKRVHDFLVEHFESQDPFTKDELLQVTNWKRSTFPTYWSKQLSVFVVPAHGGKWRVGEKFRGFIEWSRFQKHVTQVRHGVEAYSRFRFDNLLIFEFFMPLTHEGPLRQSLDALFYRDTVRRRLMAIGMEQLEKRFPRLQGEAVVGYIDRVCDWISGKIVGYSINHVAGRFRSSDLLTIDAAAAVFKKGARYLVDETTAVVRFIFPCGTALRKSPLPAAEEVTPELPDKSVEEDAARIRWLFEHLFVQSIVQVVSGEDEIWMVESGLRNCLHIWRVETQES